MRLRAACLVLLTMVVPATAAESIADQAQHAYAMFAGGLSQQDFLSAQYGNALFSGIGGKWIRLNGPDSKTGVETYGADTAKFCKSAAAVTLSSTNAVSMTLSTNLDKNNFTQVYTLIAGSTFGEHTEALPYLAAIGLGPERTGPGVDQQRALALSLANGLMQIYRPSEDVLVMTRDRGYPIVLVRCPAN